MKMKYLIAVIIVTILCYSCETVTDATDLVSTQQFTIINSYIAPQNDTIRVQVSRSISRFDSQSKKFEDNVIRDAVVEMGTDANTMQVLSFFPKTSEYILDATQLELVSGQQYFLKVSTRDGQVFRSSCRIPAEPIEDLEFQIKKSDNDDFGDSFSGNIRFQDIPGINNFYLLHNVLADSDNPKFSFREKDSLLNTIPGFTDYLTDARLDGQRLSSSVDYNFFNNRNEDDMNDPLLITSVFNVEEIMFKQFRALEDNAFNEGDIFTEIQIPPNNIEGENVFGVFAGYQVYEERYLLK